MQIFFDGSNPEPWAMFMNCMYSWHINNHSNFNSPIYFFLWFDAWSYPQGDWQLNTFGNRYFQELEKLLPGLFKMCINCSSCTISFPVVNRYTTIRSTEPKSNIVSHSAEKPFRTQREHSNIGRSVKSGQKTLRSVRLWPLWMELRAWEWRNAMQGFVCMHALAAKLRLAVPDEKLQMLNAL